MQAVKEKYFTVISSVTICFRFERVSKGKSGKSAAGLVYAQFGCKSLGSRDLLTIYHDLYNV